jgi:hypothetical protein
MAAKRERDEQADEPLTKKNGEGDSYWEISAARRATVRKFKKTILSVTENATPAPMRQSVRAAQSHRPLAG